MAELIDSGVNQDVLEQAAGRTGYPAVLPNGSFVAVDLDDGRQIVGTFRGAFYDAEMDELKIELQLPNGAAVEEYVENVAKVWHAPMGYRPKH